MSIIELPTECGLQFESIPQDWVGGTMPGLCRHELLHEIFEEQADLAPERLAVVDGERTITYGELNCRANRLAHLLCSRGIGRSSFVGILVGRSIEAYVAILGCLKSGAAYVPLDREYPADRVAFILNDCGVALLLTTADCAPQHAGFAGPVLMMDELAVAALVDETDENLPRSVTDLSPDDLCYVIYTSGSTGKPKGVEIEHRSAAHLVRAEQWLYEVEPDDRIYQGFSLAFDASVEEVWMAFSNGAALVTATPEMSHAGPALSALLTEARVTVLSCVPTLLAMLTDDLPLVRLLIVGGEACPPDLVRRWSTDSRRMVNTYGPTEATVIATFADCHPDRPVTIGRPLPNYTAYILDEHRRPVEEGQTGELYLGGIGLARGYVGRPDLTQERFVVNPFCDGGSASRLYKTGDLARFDADGNIEFHGRADLQIKLRGFRVELSEIESALIKFPGVRAAACTVHELAPGLQHLVGYVVPQNGDPISPEKVRAALRVDLPAYMIPTFIECIHEFPTLPSGKIDRKRLPVPTVQPADSESGAAPRTDGERKLLTVWKALLTPMPVALEDDFFLDLGGHSLLAARMVSELRQDRQFARLSMLDVYNYPTIEKLAPRFPDPAAEVSTTQQRRQGAPAVATLAEAAPVSAFRHFFCGLAQAAGLYFVVGFFALQWLAPYLAYTWMYDEEYPIAEAMFGALASLVLVYPVMLTLAVSVKWLVLGRVKPGRHRLWGFYYFRWWLANVFLSIVPIDYLAGTPLLGLYYRLLGARIGANVHLATAISTAYDLISIDDDTSIGSDAAVLAHTVRDGWLILDTVTIGKRCFVGNRSIVAGGSTLSDDARLEELSLLPAGETIPTGQTWRGSPAQSVGVSVCEDEGSARPAALTRFVFGLLHAIGILVVPVFVICAIFPGMMLMHYLNQIDGYDYYLVLAPLVALSFVVLLALEIALFKWLLLGRVRPGRYSLFSGFYLRKKFVDQLLELSLDVLSPLYSTIYLAPWYRLLGAKLGHRAEISTASFISPDLLSIDDEGFIADCVSLGAGRVDRNTVQIDRTHIGRRSFIGNSAVLPPGTVVGDNCLIGCLSAPPPGGQAALPGTSWLGSPGFFLPQRQKHEEFSEETTFNPTPRLRFLRAGIEFYRVIGPSTGFIVLTCLLLDSVMELREAVGDVASLLLFPLLYAGCGVGACAIVIALKWLLLGKFRPGEKPLWSTFIWRNELVIALHENLSDPFLVDKLRGTPFIAWFFRLLGAKIGKRAYIDTTCFTEYDLVRIGDDVALNPNATVQTHLFEDRVMKMSEVRIENNCSVGAMSLVLYDTRMQAGSSLGDLSLLMKNEQLPAGTRWEGIPARPVDRAEARPLPATA